MQAWLVSLWLGLAHASSSSCASPPGNLVASGHFASCALSTLSSCWDPYDWSSQNYPLVTLNQTFTCDGLSVAGGHNDGVSQVLPKVSAADVDAYDFFFRFNVSVRVGQFKTSLNFRACPPRRLPNSRMTLLTRPSRDVLRYGIVRHDSGTRHRRFPSRRGATPFVWRPTSAKQQSCDSDTLPGRRRQLVRVRARVGGAPAGRSTAAGSAADPAFSSAWHAAATKPARAAAVTSGHREHRAGWFRRRRTRRHIEHRQSKRGRLGTDGCCLLLVGGVLDSASAFALMILYYMHTCADRSRSDSIIPFALWIHDSD